MKRIYKRIPYYLLLVLLTSCKGVSKMYLFNNLKDTVQGLDSSKVFAIQKIHPLDRLSITISSTDPSLTAYLNPFSGGSAQSNLQNGSANNGGYLVNHQGQIEFPLLGKLMVAGLTTTELSELIKQKLAYYYKDLFVNVNLSGRVYFLNGRSGSVVPITNERLTVFEALAQSGIQDPTDLKREVWLIREDSGKRYFSKLNLNDKNIFESQYYYLKSNDLIYLKPGKLSYYASSSSSFKVVFSTIGLLIALITLINKL